MTTSSITAATPGTRSPTSPGPSCRLACAVGHIGSNQRHLVLDAAQTLVNDCRKSGSLPLDICSEDDRRAGDGVEILDGDIDEEVDYILRSLDRAHLHYT